jgi:hypothetical protein
MRQAVPLPDNPDSRPVGVIHIKEACCPLHFLLELFSKLQCAGQHWQFALDAGDKLIHILSPSS